MAHTPNLNVAIVGGGICGLAFAVALRNEGIKAHIFEAAVRSEFTLAGILN